LHLPHLTMSGLKTMRENQPWTINLRNATDYYLPLPPTEAFKKSIAFSLPSSWNELHSAWVKISRKCHNIQIGSKSPSSGIYYGWLYIDLYNLPLHRFGRLCCHAPSRRLPPPLPPSPPPGLCVLPHGTLCQSNLTLNALLSYIGRLY
jgi:hypothetical protein